MCVGCEETWPFFMFNTPSNWRKADKFGLGSRCIFCRRKYRMGKYYERWEEERSWSDSWKKRNADKCRIHDKNRDPLKKKAKDHNYRSRKLGASGDLSTEAIELVFLIHGRNCLRCGSDDRVAIDHIRPLTKGGSNFIFNLQPLCISCNSSKGNREIVDYRVWT